MTEASPAEARLQIRITLPAVEFEAILQAAMEERRTVSAEIRLLAQEALAARATRPEVAA
jgi:hypothetical protein